MSDHDDLINVARRWQRLYNESQAEISRLKGEVMTAAAQTRPNRERAENLERTARALLARAETAERQLEQLREENERLKAKTIWLSINLNNARAAQSDRTAGHE